MKKNKYLVIALALLGLVSSCDDAYDITQPGEVTNPDQVYTTIEALEYGVNGVYATFNPETQIQFTSIFTDEAAIGIQNGGQGNELYTFNLNSGSGAPQAIWQSNYILINFANRLMVAAQKFKDNNPYYWEPSTDDTPQDEIEEKADVTTRYDYVLMQLYGLRAYAYQDLVSWFSTDPSDDSALGVMLLDFVPSEDFDTYLPRVTNGEIYALIDADLQAGFDIYEAHPEYATSLYNVSEDFLNCVKARELVYRKKYAEALPYLQGIPMTSSTPYSLANNDAAYQAELEDTASSESIFKLARVSGDYAIGGYWNSSRSNINGAPIFEVSRSLYNVLIENPNDIRGHLGAIIDQTSKVMSPALLAIASQSVYRSQDVLVVNKYPGSDAQDDPLMNDIKVFTLGEMILLRAEALIGTGNVNGANNTYANWWIRRLRNARELNNAAVTLPTDEVNKFAVILNERRKELAFMGFRYLDLKRLGPVTGINMDRFNLDCARYGSCTLSSSDYRFTMPIPNTELIANPQIRGQQNAGY